MKSAILLSLWCLLAPTAFAAGTDDAVSVYLDTELINSSGENVSINDLTKESSSILVNFWASWCQPCMNELPVIANLAKSGAFEVVLVNIEEDGVINSSGVMEKYRSDIADQNWLFDLNERYKFILGIEAVPVTLLIDKHSKTVNFIKGQIDPSNKLLQKASE